MDCIKHPNYVWSISIMNCPECRRAPIKSNRPGVRLDKLNGTQATAQRKRIRERDNYTCQICKIGVRVGECDHIIGLEQGGSNDDANVQLLCKTCHYEKTCRDNGFKIKTGSSVDGLPTSASHHWNI